MSTLDIKFGDSKVFSTFGVRQNHKIACQSSDYTYSADKAGLISEASFGNNRCDSVARIGNGSAYFLLVDITNFSLMRQNPKNLTVTVNNSTRTSTANARNSVSTTPCFYSKGRYINLKGRLNKAERELEKLREPNNIYRVRLVFFYQVKYWDKKNYYEIDKHYSARSREEALGKAYFEMGLILPDYNLQLSNAGGTQLCTLVK